MTTWIPIAHLALTLLILLWDVVVASRVMHVPRAPRAFAAVTALCGFLVLPAVAIHLATSTVLTGRALVMVTAIWPLTLTLFVVQSGIALGRRLVHPLIGLPILVFNAILAATAALSVVSASGTPLLEFPLALLVAQSDVLSIATSGAVLTSPLFVAVPILSPAFPAWRGATATLRAVLAAYAVMWTAMVTLAVAKGRVVLREYRQYEQDRLTERPSGDFVIGVKILPDIARAPSALALRGDLALVHDLQVAAVSITVVPDAADAAVLDSIARVVAPLRRDSAIVIVALGYRGKLFPARPDAFDRESRLRAIDQVVRRIRPDILIPAEDPYGSGARAFGRLPLATWTSYIGEAAALAKRLRPRTRIGIAASTFGSNDSTLYVWAASAGSPVDVPGFSFFPGSRGAQDLNARMRAADRWMAADKSQKPVWVFNAGGYPLAHGERSQERALWGTLSWATAHPRIKGLIVASASDYGGATGLQSPGGRRRPAAGAVTRALTGLREAVGTSPTLGDTSAPAVVDEP